MKRMLLYISAATMIFFGCGQNESFESDIDKDYGGLKFIGQTEEFSEQTRTALGMNNSVVWTANDEIAVFAASTIAGKYRVTAESDGSTNGKFEYVSGGEGFTAGTEIETNVAIYPYEEDLICSSSYVIGNVTLPSLQYYNAESFPQEGFPMAAITADSKDMVLNFKNIGGALRLWLKGTSAVKTITLTGNDGELIAGDCSVAVHMDGSAPSVEMSDNAEASIILDCGEGVQLNETTATPFTLALAPTVFTKGFTIIVTDTEGKTDTVQATSANTVNRSRVLNMPEVTVATEAGAINLSAGGTANCYIVQEPGVYKLKTVKGNSQESVGAATSAEIVWTTFCTFTAPKEGQLIESAEYSDGYITFTVPEPFKEGNAVIAAKDANGTILWSWHIWMVQDNINEVVYANDAGILMDRNLGATSAVKEERGTIGLMYQWGRKDPIISAYKILNSKDISKSYGRTWSAQASDSSTGTIEYAIQNPTVFITNATGDWLYEKDNTRWGSTKTIYDPCPAGWRVPDGGPEGFWDKAGITVTINNNASADGLIILSPYCTPDSWWPAVGRYNSSLSLQNQGSYGYYWSASSQGTSYSYEFTFKEDGSDIKPTLPSGSNVQTRAHGHCVRCFKE